MDETTIIDPGPPERRPILRLMLGQLVISTLLVLLQGAILALRQRFSDLAKKTGETT